MSNTNPTAKATPTGLWDLENAQCGRGKNKLVAKSDRHSTSDLLLLHSYTLESLSQKFYYCIVIPTFNSYTLHPLEEVVHFAGLLVGITRQHIYSAFAQPFISFFFKRYDFRSILL